MKSTHLIILLRKYEKMLGEAIDNIEADLPDALKVEAVTHFFKEPYTYYPILGELVNLLSHIEEDIEILKM